MRQKHLNKARTECAEAGFSLIELAIVMVIISLLVLPLIRYYDLYRVNKAMGDTKDKQIALNTAINEFYGANGRYPCPSDRSLGFGDPGHGKELCPETAALAPNSCSAGNGYCHVNTGSDRAMIGSIPYVTLDIPYSRTLDGWNRNMSYVVSEDLAIIPAGTEFNPNNSNVVLNAFDEDGNPIIVKHHGLIISHGPNGAGSYDSYGVRTPCLLDVYEGENCNDNNATFVQRKDNGASLGNNDGYYDDLVAPSSWNSSSVWEFDDPDDDPDTANDNVVAVVPGNLGVGTKTPTEKLEVVGGLKTKNIHSDKICDVNGENCFPAATIGGLGIHCGDGQVLTGIAYNAPICKNLPVTGVQSKTCPSGQVVTAILNGVVQCGVP